MIKAKIKKSFLVISPPPFGGKHSTVNVSLYKLYNITNSYTSEQVNNCLFFYSNFPSNMLICFFNDIYFLFYCYQLLNN